LAIGSSMKGENSYSHHLDSDVSKCFPLSMLADILCECILPYYFHEAYPSDFFFGGRLVFLLLIGLPIIHLLSLRN
jgi:hypothetical protein